MLLESPGAAAFQRQQGPHLLCLSMSGSRMLGCPDGLQDPFNLAASDDLGKSWKALLNFSQFRGRAPCQQVQTACAADWQYQQTVLASANPKRGSGCETAGSSSKEAYPTYVDVRSWPDAHSPPFQASVNEVNHGLGIRSWI